LYPASEDVLAACFNEADDDGHVPAVEMPGFTNCLA
jgi:hypothetical protein